MHGSLNLKDKVAVITGAGRGIGAAIAQTYARAGMKIAICARSDGALQEMAASVETECLAIALDVADPVAVEAFCSQVIAQFGKVDVLVNNATYIHHQLIEKMPFWEKDLDAVKILDVGLRSAYVASWHAARMMVAQGSGVIAFGSSFGGSCYMHGPA